MTLRDVVITGVGAVTPLGVGARALHERWTAGACGIRDGEAPCADFTVTDHLTIKEARRADRSTQLAITAGDEALAEAGWTDELPYDSELIGCVLGTGIGGIETLESNHDSLRDTGPGAVSALAVPLMMSNAGSAALSLRHGLRGPVFSVVSACAAGSHAIGTALRMIQHGEAEAMVTGGAEAPLTPLSRAAFGKMNALSESGVSRPFDARRDGFVMGEGAGVLVLENGDSARARGARILGTLRGYGSTGDAHLITAPHKEGRGGARAMTIAIGDAGLTPADVDYINAHGTSTQLNDRAETLALKLAFAQARLGGSRGADPGVVDQVGDRAPARRRRRGGGRRDDPRVARPDRTADDRLGGARRGPRPRLRARHGTTAGDVQRQAAGRAVQQLRLRRPQRHAVPAGGVTAQAHRRRKGDMSERGPVLLTGATGFLGMEVLGRLVEQTDRDVIALVRAPDDGAAQDRLDAVIAMLLPPGGRPRRARVRGLAADLEQPDLGLSPIARDRLAGSIGAVVHCSASISFVRRQRPYRRGARDDGRRCVRRAASGACAPPVEEYFPALMRDARWGKQALPRWAAERQALQHVA